MLYKLSIANIKKSFKDYAIYFTTLILGVCIFYIFNSMDSQTAMLAVSSRQSEVIDLLIQLLSAVSIFVSLILGFLIIYASRFLIKKRNKEFGIYMTLGMSKRKISAILLIETFIIGLISLGVGLLLGIVISQITSIFIANMFEANMTDFTFNISKSAIIKTIIYFGIIYFIVMIFNTIIVNKNKLINLLQASKKGENIKVRNSIICIILFIISVILLGSADYMVTGGVNALMQHDVSILLIPIGMGVVGTVLFFYSLSGMILKIITKFPKLYYSKLNTFVFKQINSKINTMIVSISIICLMLFITLCLLSSALTIKNYFNDSINKFAPVDLSLVGYYNEDNREINLIDFFNSDNIIKMIKMGIIPKMREAVVSYCYIDDLISTLSCSIDKGKCGNIYICATEKSIGFYESVRLISSFMNRKVILVPVPRWIMYSIAFLLENTCALLGKKPFVTRSNIIAMTTDRIYDLSKNKEDFGFISNVTMEEGIRRCVMYNKDKGLF